MKSQTEDRNLSPRDREILRDVVTTYIMTGEPVSSRLVAKRGRHGLSAATIRNVMADLDEMGYLSHPHSSAGRVPTEEGYHFYIDTLMPSRSVSRRLRRYIEDNLGESQSDGDRLLTSASHLLSELSDQIGIVLTPALGETVIKSVGFLPLTGQRVLCVLVSASGFIDHKVIDLPWPLERKELVRVSNYVTDNFGGQSVREIRARLLVQMAEERAQVDELLANAIALADRALRDDQGPEVLVEGTTTLLSRPELADVDRVRRLLDTFSDKAGLVQLLNQIIDGPGVRVVIGSDSDLTSDLDFSLVATSFGVGESQGALGVFGPARMPYQKTIPLVELLGERLSRALERVYRDDA